MSSRADVSFSPSLTDIRKHMEDTFLKCPSVERKLGALYSLPIGMRRMLSMEGMDMDLETVSCVWNILDPQDPNLVDLLEVDQGEGLGLHHADLSSGLL